MKNWRWNASYKRKPKNMYFWMKNAHYKEMYKKSSVEEQINFIRKKILYVGIGFLDRKVDHCQANLATEDFDIYLRMEELWASVLESVCIWVFKSMPDCENYNCTFSAKLGTAVTAINTDNFDSVLTMLL